ncbi:MAG TPA: A/G-specific adenine glycosylase [Gammaproteobacteria bacterium]|nr:A/G-specific adenine glycosylase [Gammaproteobacteria bacterium]
MTSFAKQLLDWFDQHGRKSLPWQTDKTPYRVWVSEIMLQQTQVAMVIPYFKKFLARYPSVDELAAATEDEVLHLWTGLGYYARARNLHISAKKVMAEHNGEFPATVDELTTLPGIGRSTAGAIAAICHDTHAAILDGNVKRVLARHFTIDGWPGETETQKLLWKKAEALTPHDRIADYTQAIMDLGATVCTRSSPDCPACPYFKSCQARINGTIDQYPGKKPKKVMPLKSTVMLIVELNGNVLLKKRPSKGLWGGLWSFPECESVEAIDSLLESLNLEELERTLLPEFRHTFTHYHLDIEPIRVTIRKTHRIAEPGAEIWFNVTAPQSVGLTKPVTKILAELSANQVR